MLASVNQILSLWGLYRLFFFFFFVNLIVMKSVPHQPQTSVHITAMDTLRLAMCSDAAYFQEGPH